MTTFQPTAPRPSSTRSPDLAGPGAAHDIRAIRDTRDTRNTRDTRDAHEARDTFERALRERRAALRDDTRRDTETSSGAQSDAGADPVSDTGCDTVREAAPLAVAPMDAAFAFFATPQPRPDLATAPPPAAGRVETDAAPTRVALDAALALAPAAAVAAAADGALQPAASAGVWEVALPQPFGAALALRATQVAPAGAPAQAAWALELMAGRRDAARFAQHAPRLTERLQARAVHAEVRIERGEDEAR
ncbi:MAG: hypothetical protein AB7G13_02585 [Lautropia sp.]